MTLAEQRRLYQRAPLLAAAAIGLLVWQLVDWLGPWPKYLFPGPWDVALAIGRLVSSGRFITSLGATFARLIAGFLIALVIGGAFAAVIIRWPTMRRAFTPFMLGIQSLPGVAWVPLAILWFGYTETALIFVTVMGSVFSVSMAYADGVLSVPGIYYRVGRNFGLSAPAQIFKVGVPAALPQLISGTKQGWSFAWRSLIGAEIVFASVGLGFLLNLGREFLDIAQVFAMLLTILVIGIAFEKWVFAVWEDRVRKLWGIVH